MKSRLKEKLEAAEKKNIVFYGISQKECGLTSEEMKKWNAYYMDLDIPIQADAERCIRSFEDAEEKQIDAFVVMRQMIADQAAFQKMLDYGKAHAADIYDENGREIGTICREAMQCGYCDREKLEREIAEHEYISFDIFDTLLTRKTLLPEDVFELAGRRLAARGIGISDFKEKRMQAQADLGLTNPTLEEIYDKFRQKYKVTAETAREALLTEMVIEQEALIPRKEMVEVYRQCVAQGKKVSLVSDMYIPEQSLVPILEKNGITGYDSIYISCDKRQLKLQGLLETYRAELGETGSFLHIGDHLIHDGICAGLAGMDYCLVANSYKAALKTAYRTCIETAKSLEEHLILGLSIAKVLNSPFAFSEENEGIRIAADYDYGYGFCAAVLSQFAFFLYEEVKREGFDDILFAARDGYLVQKMYDLLRERDQEDKERMPGGIYFYTSRKAAVMTCINNEAYINMLIDISDGMEPKKLMKERFGLRESQILPYDEKSYDIIHKYVWAHVDDIFKRAEEAKRNYFKYMGNIHLQIGGKYAFMDFVSSGTSQKSLAKIVPFEIKGIYAGWNSGESQEEAEVKPLYCDTSTFFLQYYKIIETFMTSEEPSLSHFDKNGEPVFQKQERTEQELSYVEEMQRACMDFFQDYLELSGGASENISNDFTDSLFAVSKEAVLQDTDSVLKNISLMDDWRQIRLKKDKMIQDYGRR